MGPLVAAHVLKADEHRRGREAAAASARPCTCSISILEEGPEDHGLDPRDCSTLVRAPSIQQHTNTGYGTDAQQLHQSIVGVGPHSRDAGASRVGYGTTRPEPPRPAGGHRGVER